MNTKPLLFILSGLLFADLTLTAQQKVEQWNRFETTLKYVSHGNDFEDVDLSATFVGPDTEFVVSGFYDGNGIFRIRFMPQRIGTWNYITSSNIAELANRKGTFQCVRATGNNHGIAKVSDVSSFKYADGTQYYPFGTTSYSWIHLGPKIEEMTLEALRKSGFNKLRMCVFPKTNQLVKGEPELYPFAIRGVTKDSTGKQTKVWDFDQFNPAFFQHLEKRIDDLSQIGVEADLILFHPYDKGRWGFDAMPNEADVRYVKYLTARLASFRNVWWSLANEWDYAKHKSHDDWDLLAKTVVASDPYRHLCSIHGSTATYFEYWKPEFTHVSVQDEAPVEYPCGAATLRNIYHKPVIFDEVGYEGNLKLRWGRYSPDQMTYLVWMGTIAGTYVTHGECYLSKDDTDTGFWTEGGPLRGTSWKRIAFLRKLVEEGPGPLGMSDVSRDCRTASAGKGYYIVYFGKEMNDSWLFNLPVRNGSFGKLTSGIRFKVEIIDTWDMTIQPCPLTFETTPEIDYRVYDKDMKKVRLPLKPYIALRITEIR